jgi:hypothetical protein
MKRRLSESQTVEQQKRPSAKAGIETKLKIAMNNFLGDGTASGAKLKIASPVGAVCTSTPTVPQKGSTYVRPR